MRTATDISSRNVHYIHPAWPIQLTDAEAGIRPHFGGIDVEFFLFFRCSTS